MAHIINIPNVDRDERIGSAFNHLFQVIQQTDNSNDMDLFWDLSNTSCFHPFFLAPLVIYKQKCNKNINCIGKPNRIKGYLNTIHFDNPLEIVDNSRLKEVLYPYIKKTYLPVCQFDLCRGNIDGLQTILQGIIKEQSEADYRITTPLSYLLGELIDNMTEHSHGKHGYIFSQYLKKGKHSVNHVFLSPTSIINFTSKKQSYDDTRRSSRDNELLQRAQSDL